jgi:hypothetical protein
MDGGDIAKVPTNVRNEESMHMRRKILMGVFAFALPVGSMAVLSPSAFAKTVQNPISCTGFTGRVTFGTSLTTAGVATSAKKSNPTLITSGAFTCAGGKSGSAGTITDAGGKNTKLAKTDPRYNKATGVKYVTGSWSEFTSAGGSLKKTLKVINFTIAGSPVQFKTKSASEVLFGACGSDVGFKISGQVKSGTYANKTSSVLACLGSDFPVEAPPGPSGNFGADYNHAQGVSGANIDGTVSKATL